MLMLGIVVGVGILSFGATKLLYSTVSLSGARDHPNERSLHSLPVPRTGGVAILGSAMLGGLMLMAVGPADVWRTPSTGWICGMTLLLVTLSFWDDRTGLSPGLRLSVQMLAAAGVVWGGSLQVSAVDIPAGGVLVLGQGAPIVTALLLAWMTNLYNFMDGMDGLAGGMTVVGFGILSGLSWIGGLQDLALMAALVAAATGGFLYFNLPPAKIFMGDVGSVPLGFLAGSLALKGIDAGLFDPWVPLLIFLPFVIDSTVTLCRRLFRGEKVWRAHREHWYQRLVLAGWSHRRTLWTEYALMLVSGMSAVLYVHATDLVRAEILLGWSAICVMLAWAVRVTEYRAHNRRRASE